MTGMYRVETIVPMSSLFAFAIWHDERLFLARDHMGQKPLFFCQTPRGFAFASEVKGVLASGLVPREANLEVFPPGMRPVLAQLNLVVADMAATVASHEVRDSTPSTARLG